MNDLTPGQILFVCHELACLALLCTVFCRSVRCDHNTRIGIRIAFFVLGGVACLGIVAPMLWPDGASWYTVILLLAIVLVQSETAHYWSAGTPHQFRREAHAKEG